MEKLDIICIGSIKEKFMKEMIAEYQKRLSRFCKLTITELSEKKLPDNPSELEIQKALMTEGESMLKCAPSDAFKIAMCIEGEKLCSVKFAKKLQSGFARSGKVAIFIGSSYGMSETLKSSCDMRLSMSDMTFPHQLMRVILLEQVYRSYRIISGEPYHK